MIPKLVHHSLFNYWKHHLQLIVLGTVMKPGEEKATNHDVEPFLPSLAELSHQRLSFRKI